MKNLFSFCLLLVPWFGMTQGAEERVYLDPCLKLCVIYYSDNSSSMNNAISDVHRWAHNLVLIPQSEGYVEIGIAKFGASYQMLCNPTSDKKELKEAINLLSSLPTESVTYPGGGLYNIKQLLEDRKEKNPEEVQVLVIHSDYYFADDHTNSMDELKEMIRNDVQVIASIPQAFDGKAGEVRTDSIKEMEEFGCVYIGSSFAALKTFFTNIRALIPCG